MPAYIVLKPFNVHALMDVFFFLNPSWTSFWNIVQLLPYCNFYCCQSRVCAAAEFAPDITIISAGFDAARGDPLGCCDVRFLLILIAKF